MPTAVSSRRTSPGPGDGMGTSITSIRRRPVWAAAATRGARPANRAERRCGVGTGEGAYYSQRPDQMTPQERADRIRTFRLELATLEHEGALELSGEQRARLDAHLDRTLKDLARQYDVDTN